VFSATDPHGSNKWRKGHRRGLRRGTNAEEGEENKKERRE
jgi:hypothetical protein